MFKGLGNLVSLVRQAQQMGDKMQEIQRELKSKRVTGSAGGGMVEVEVNGVGDVLRVRIESTLTDHEMIEGLLPAAINQATQKAKQLQMESMQSITSGVDLPGLNEAIEQITGGIPEND